MRVCDKCGKENGIRTRIGVYSVYASRPHNPPIRLATKELCCSCWKTQQKLLESVL